MSTERIVRSASVSAWMPLDTTSHPNELDCWRIARALARRKLYRYVHPQVQAIAGGYVVVSPCCSRKVDPDGGLIDIARMECLRNGQWLMYAKDHDVNDWVACGRFRRLLDVIHFLNEDTERIFWP